MFTPSTFQGLSRSAIAVRELSSDTAGKHRISLALYRQLLRWCKETEDDIPLSYFIPPVHMAAPQIDGDRLKSMTEEQRTKFPTNSIVETKENHITCPIHNVSDARDFFKTVFRLNQAPDKDVNIQKQRITLAFEGIKSLNELTQALQTLKQNRAKHVLRDGVEFRVGQVVKHKVESWRGVITGWSRIDLNTDGKTYKPSSLTQRTYQLDPVDAIRYNVLLDSGDAYLHYSKRRETVNPNQVEVYQSDLQLVADERYTSTLFALGLPQST